MLEERVGQLEAKLRDLEAVPEVRKHRDRLRDEAKHNAEQQAKRAAAEAEAQRRAALPLNQQATNTPFNPLTTTPAQNPYWRDLPPHKPETTIAAQGAPNTSEHVFHFPDQEKLPQEKIPTP
jgi:hypothetical protein